MTTPNNSADLIALPNLTVAELLSLLLQIETEANALQAKLSEQNKPLPASLLKSLARVSEAREGLSAAYGAAPSPAPNKRIADYAMDTAWRAAEAFLRGYTLLRSKHVPGPAEANRIYALWFYDGLRFITLAPEIEYQESKKRLDLLDSEKLSDTLFAIGGAPFLDDLKAALLNYGEALHVTSPREAPSPALRPLWDSALTTLRQYVTKVVALEEPDEPETLTYIKTLLAPLKDWEEKAAPQIKKPATPTTDKKE